MTRVNPAVVLHEIVRQRSGTDLIVEDTAQNTDGARRVLGEVPTAFF
jgi:hypothetical protein